MDKIRERKLCKKLRSWRIMTYTSPESDLTLANESVHDLLAVHRPHIVNWGWKQEAIQRICVRWFPGMSCG